MEIPVDEGWVGSGSKSLVIGKGCLASLFWGDWVSHFVSFILRQSFGDTGARIGAFSEKVLLNRRNNSRLKRLARIPNPN